jgi:CrcB protein
MMASVTAICFGASAGALLRWLFGLWLNPLWPAVPLGTLAANLVGGYLIGAAFAVFSAYPALAPEWRLLVITGFLGGLTTFSTFSLEVVTAAQRGDFVSAAAIAALHLAGSLALTALGLATFYWIRAG